MYKSKNKTMEVKRGGGRGREDKYRVISKGGNSNVINMKLGLHTKLENKLLS